MSAHKNPPDRLVVPDLDYWKEQVRCQVACPVHTDARGYVRAIAEGRDHDAYLIARGPNPLASICGRVCAAPCESACRRGEIDAPVSIRALKRFVCERFGSESDGGGGKRLVDELVAAASRGHDHACEDLNELAPLLRALTAHDIETVEGRSVGIIGSGPAGLAAAHDLALLGFSVTIYEMEPVLAGMLAVGIPAYRLPRELIREEVAVIQALGVEAVTECEVGRDVSFTELRARHDAIVIAVGAKRSRELPIPGANAEGVMGGVEFLRDVALDEAPELGRRVVVIGGGNVAYDIGRTVIRQTSVDAARAALRQHHDSVVTLCSLESLEEMPADDAEIIEGDEEGVIRRNGMGPVAILTHGDGRVRGVEFRRCTRVYDENRRFAPEFDDDDREIIECDQVLLAVGQTVDLRFLDADRDGVELDERGFIRCDSETGVTPADDVFVAGDLAYGPKLLIHAVASGKAVARSIYRALTGKHLRYDALELHLALPSYGREVGYECRERITVPTLGPHERLTSQSYEVERGYDETAARMEASRCLDCGVNTIFDGSRCVLCGGCVDVCPHTCLEIVSVERLAEFVCPSDIEETLGNQLGDNPRANSSAIVKDETSCIRCALCAERCPTGAITMERFSFREVPTCRAA